MCTDKGFHQRESLTRLSHSLTFPYQEAFPDIQPKYSLSNVTPVSSSYTLIPPSFRHLETEKAKAWEIEDYDLAWGANKSQGKRSWKEINV